MQFWNKFFIKISKLVGHKRDKERTHTYTHTHTYKGWGRRKVGEEDEIHVDNWKKSENIKRLLDFFSNCDVFNYGSKICF